MNNYKLGYLQVDVFGVPLEYKTDSARTSGLVRVVSQLQNLGVTLSSIIPYSDLYHLVALGFLSIKTASYFLNGTVSLRQIMFLKDFLKHYDYCLTFTSSPAKCFELWQKQENVVPENTFLFPLAELDCSLEDEKEFAKLREPMDLKELQNIK